MHHDPEMTNHVTMLPSKFRSETTAYSDNCPSLFLNRPSLLHPQFIPLWSILPVFACNIGTLFLGPWRLFLVSNFSQRISPPVQTWTDQPRNQDVGAKSQELGVRSQHLAASSQQPANQRSQGAKFLPVFRISYSWY